MKASELKAKLLAKLQSQPKVEEYETSVLTNAPNTNDSVVNSALPLATSIYSAEQQSAITLAKSGVSFVINGQAGSGKTFTAHGICLELIDKYAHEQIGGDLKHIQPHALPILIVSYTNLSVLNIQKRVPPELKDNCITMHKFLEFMPENVEYINADGLPATKKIFKPNRNALNKFPPTIRTIIFEESGLIECKLFLQYREALENGHRPQEIFLGDLNQLSSIFSPPVLGFKSIMLPGVELTTVRRQALDSPVLALATKVLEGEHIPASDFPSVNVPGTLTLHAWKKQGTPESCLEVLGRHIFPKAFNEGAYDPQQDIILMTQNVSFGTIELNKYIAEMLARHHKREVYEILHGFNNKIYLSIGESVFYQKFKGTVTNIIPNQRYFGRPPKMPSLTLDYWGNGGDGEMMDLTADEVLSRLAANTGDSEGDRTPSHVVTVYLEELGCYVDVADSTTLGRMELGYCLTMRKAQGSEWRRVFAVIHHTNSPQINREAIYTMITRAKEELYMICPPDTFTKGITRQAVPGKAMHEKAEHFKGKMSKVDFDLGLLA